MNDFAAFILTHGRPNKVLTYNTLKKQGYTGKIYLIIDNEDKTADQYYKCFGDQVIMFDKKEIAETFDQGDTFNDRRAIVYARNASFKIAIELGIRYFIQLDDDYTAFSYKFNHEYEFLHRKILNLDRFFESFLEFYKSTNATSIAMAQNGDFLGGRESGFIKKLTLKRKCMNTFICDTKRPFQFIGRINEDVNTYTNLGGRGFLFLTVPNVAINQLSTQTNKGGMTDLYLDGGTYLKSFYSVMYSPSCVTITEMGQSHKRLHHKVNWNAAVPVILDEKYKKAI